MTVPAGAVTDLAGRANAASETLRVAVQGPESDDPGPMTDQGLTASFHEAPASHDGGAALSFDVHFGEASKLRWRTMLNHAFAVTNARVTRAQRLDNPHHEGHGRLPNQRWEITVKPGGTGDIAIALDAAADCSQAGVICTPEGRKLSNATSETVQGPYALSVADARAEEGMDETIDFVVTLSRTSTETVDYATADVTAAAGQDYTATNGTLTFTPGDTSRTVSVPVLDDAHAEDPETLTLRLSNARHAAIADAEATGTISNSDPLQQAWLARFGRTVGSQVLEAVSQRLDADPSPHLRIGGVDLDGSPLADTPLAPERLAVREPGTQRPEGRVPTGRDLLLGSSFHLVSDAAQSGDAATGLAAASAQTSRVRLVLEGGRSIALSSGAVGSCYAMTGPPPSTSSPSTNSTDSSPPPSTTASPPAPHLITGRAAAPARWVGHRAATETWTP